MPTTDTTDTATETTDTESETTGTTTETTENGTAQATATNESTTNGTATATETTGTATETGTTTETTETATETTNTTTGTETTTTESTTTATETETTSETTDAESDADAELAAFAGQSSTRTAVLERLVTGPANASDIATRDPPNVEDMRGITGKLSVSKTRSSIETLRDRGLVELLVDGETPIYSLTAKGERILFEIERDDG